MGKYVAAAAALALCVCIFVYKNASTFPILILQNMHLKVYRVSPGVYHLSPFLSVEACHCLLNFVL